MTEELNAVADGMLMGRLLRHRQRNRLSFEYNPEWQDRPEAFPLSVSMPLAASSHGDRHVRPFLEGLLPDNDRVLEQWAKRFKVSRRNPFALLRYVGEECAGAVQFIHPDRIQQWSGSPKSGRITWLTRRQLEDRIQLLVKDHSAARTGSDSGHFSLAGAQAKTAFHWDATRRRWGVPEGPIPTTHILKPATGEYDGLILNEHFCLQLAGAIGMPAVQSTIENIGGYPVIVIERYDRFVTGGRIRRVHQEDFCQALGVSPHDKYQNQGGPDVVLIGQLIRDQSAETQTDLWRFADALVFNWLVSGTDAHAKNYSLLIGPSGQVRMSPLYDLSSSLPYPRQIDPHKARLAMKIGGKYRLKLIGRREWEKCAGELRVEPIRLIDRIHELTEHVLSRVEDVAHDLVKQKIESAIVERLVKSMSRRSIECRKLLASKSR